MSLPNYSLSFTTGAALIHESVIVAKLYAELRGWTAVQSRVLKENCFQARTESSLKKLYGEVSRRLKHLTDVQLNMLATGADSQVKALTWLAICRHYTFVRDFTLEVIVPHYGSSRFLLSHEDYDAFFNAKAEWHENLDSASRQTKSKARQVLFRIIKECGLVSNDNEIQHQYLEDSLKQIISDNSFDDLRLFPGMN